MIRNTFCFVVGRIYFKRLSSPFGSDLSAKCLDFISPVTHLIFLWLWERLFESRLLSKESW